MVKNNTKFKETELGPIPEEWEIVTLPKVSRNLDSKRRPLSSAERERMKGEYPYYGAAGIIDWVNDFILDGKYLLVAEDGTVTDSFGHPTLQLTDGKFWVSNHAHVLQCESYDELKYIYYALKNTQITAFVTGAVQPKLNQENLNSIPLAYPTEATERNEISSILSSLDDKIELNRQINANLEKIASALFKRWFVDFEFPDKNGKPYRSSGGKMVESEMGEIPKGWRVGKLGDIAKNIKRSIKASDITSDKPYIGLEHMPRHSISLSEWGSGEGLGSNKFEFKQGEILFGKLRPYFHKVGVAPVDGVCSTDILVVAPKEQEYFGFALGHISSEIFIKFTEGSSSGTRMPRTNWSDMAKYEVILPPMPVVSTFSEIIYSLINLLLENVLENHTLAAQRDFLLPRLMSGKIRMK